ncbi:unnamed protein product, partial [Heterosigma akashiwo]
LTVTRTSLLGFQDVLAYHNPREVAEAIVARFPEAERAALVTGAHVSPLGLVTLTTVPHRHWHVAFGRLPCPDCGRCFGGERGLRMHRMADHGLSYEAAAPAALRARTALVVYRPRYRGRAGGGTAPGRGRWRGGSRRCCRWGTWAGGRAPGGPVGAAGVDGGGRRPPGGDRPARVDGADVGGRGGPPGGVPVPGGGVRGRPAGAGGRGRPPAQRAALGGAQRPGRGVRLPGAGVRGAPGRGHGGRDDAAALRGVDARAGRGRLAAGPRRRGRARPERVRVQRGAVVRAERGRPAAGLAGARARAGPRGGEPQRALGLPQGGAEGAGGGAAVEEEEGEGGGWGAAPARGPRREPALGAGAGERAPCAGGVAGRAGGAAAGQRG